MFFQAAHRIAFDYMQEVSQACCFAAIPSSLCSSGIETSQNSERETDERNAQLGKVFPREHPLQEK